jgi:hypothetical protein
MSAIEMYQTVASSYGSPQSSFPSVNRQPPPLPHLTSLRRRKELRRGLIIRHIRHITRRARILPPRIPELNRRHAHRLEDRTAVVPEAHRRPIHPRRVALRRRQAGDQTVIDDQRPSGACRTDAVVEVHGVGRHAFEVHAAVAFNARGGGAAGAGFEGNISNKLSVFFLFF